MAHGEGIHQECGEKCRRLVQMLSSLNPPTRLSRYPVARVVVHTSSVGLGAEPSLEGSFQQVHWLAGSCIRDRDPEKAVEFGPQMASELRAMVGGNVIKHSKA